MRYKFRVPGLLGAALRCWGRRMRSKDVWRMFEADGRGCILPNAAAPLEVLCGSMPLTAFQKTLAGLL